MDAGSTKIKIKISDSIIIEDDGCGIDDMEKLCKSGYTSKDDTSYNILGITTNKVNFSHGFRGQALAAISELCDVLISSRIRGCPGDEELGRVKNYTSGEYKRIPMEYGTIIKINNLFKNCAIRRQLNIKSKKKNCMRLVKLIESFCYVYNVYFTLLVDGKQILAMQGSADYKKYAIERHGSTYLEVEDVLFYFILFPLSKDNCQSIILDKRVVFSSKITSMINNIFRRYFNYQPVFLLIIRDEADVNISVDKSEIVTRNFKVIENRLNFEMELYFSQKSFIHGTVKKVDDNLKQFEQESNKTDMKTTSDTSYLFTNNTLENSDNISETINKAKSVVGNSLFNCLLNDSRSGKEEASRFNKSLFGRILNNSNVENNNISNIGSNINTDDNNNVINGAINPDNNSDVNTGTDTDINNDLSTNILCISEEAKVIENNVFNQKGSNEKCSGYKDNVEFITNSCKSSSNKSKIDIENANIILARDIKNTSVLPDTLNDNILSSNDSLFESLPTNIPMNFNKSNILDKKYPCIDSAYLHVKDEVLQHPSVIIEKDDFKNMNIIGQFNNGFIVCTLKKNNSELLITVDQHAADEIYNFEILKKGFFMKKQRLINPIKLEITPVQQLIVEDNYSVLEKNGFIVKDMGLLTIPVYKGYLSTVNDFMSLLDNISVGIYESDKFRKIMASKACRTSVMIGAPLGIKEMRRIVDNLSTLELPWNCPHGRPTFKIITVLEI